MDRPLVAGLGAQRAVKLELQDVRQEIARIGYVAGHVVLGARVEVGFGAGDRGRDALVLLAELPPRGVVVLRRDLQQLLLDRSRDVQRFDEGRDPFTGKPLFVERDMRRKEQQKNLIQRRSPASRGAAYSSRRGSATRSARPR